MITRAALRGELVEILTKAIGRGDSPELASRELAAGVLDAIVADDAAPEWDGIRVGREQLAAVIAVYRTLP